MQPMSKKHRATIVSEAVRIAGGLGRLGDQVGVSAQAVYRWRREGQIPVDRVLDVERATGIPREKLRPDVFGAPRPRPRARSELAA